MRWSWILLLGGCAYSSAFKGADRVTEAMCERAFACQLDYPTDAELTFEALYGNSVPRCVAEIGPADPDAWKTAEDDGVLVYDADAAKACAEALELRACDAVFTEPLPEVCDGAFAGTLAELAACTFDEQCESGWCRDGACTAP